MDDLSAEGPTTELLEDPHFRALLRQMERQAIPWEQFLELPQPENTSPVRTWEVLLGISRSVGIKLVPPDLDDMTYWYRRTYELTDLVETITVACRSNSRIWRTVKASAGQHFLVRMRIAEAIAAARLDGLAISEVDTAVLLSYDKAPQNDTERLVVNTFQADDHLADLLDEPFSPELFMHLRDLLLEGVDSDALKPLPSRLGLIPFEYDDEIVERFADRQMRYIASYANHEAGEEWDFDLLRGLLIKDSLRYYRPLGSVSSQVGQLASRLYGLKHDLPVLGLLPISQTSLDWEEGRIPSSSVACDRTAYFPHWRRSQGDLTVHHTLVAQLALQALRRVENSIEEWERRDAEMREILRKDPLLNHRQRSVLSRALRSPEAEFRIRYHKSNHNIAYTTARRDLLNLAKKGYLVMQQRGKAFVFVPSSSLQELVETGSGQ
jgi:Fic family protein